AVEAVHRRSIAGTVVLGERLERDQAAQQDVLAEVNGAHAAAAKHLQHAVLAIDDEAARLAEQQLLRLPAREQALLNKQPRQVAGAVRLGRLLLRRQESFEAGRLEEPTFAERVQERIMGEGDGHVGTSQAGATTATSSPSFTAPGEVGGTWLDATQEHGRMGR